MHSTTIDECFEEVFKEDKEIITFISNLKTIADINVQVLENVKLQEIEDTLKQIKSFISEHKNQWYEISKMHGFIPKTPNVMDYLKLSKTPDQNKYYLYYIADKKIKAATYYLRYLNFIKYFQVASDKLFKILENFTLEVDYGYKEDTDKAHVYKLEIKNNDIKFTDLNKQSECSENNISKETFDCHEQNFKICIHCSQISFLKDNKKINQINIKLSQIQLSEIQGQLDFIKELKSNIEKIKINNKSIKILDEVLDFIKHSTLQELIELKTILASYRLVLVQDKSYIKYALFNNCMKEISYKGAAFKYNWYWVPKKRYLFRNVGVVPYKLKSYTRSNTKYDYMYDMFNNIIQHMNKGDNKPILASYSLDPYLDIYKYLQVPKSKKSHQIQNILMVKDLKGTVIISEQKDKWFKEIKFTHTILKESNDNYCNTTFAVIKNAPINYIFSNDGSEKYDFYQFINLNTQNDNDKLINKYNFSVEVYSEQVSKCNGIKRKLNTYLESWRDDDELNPYIMEKATKISSIVADDKEVVMSGQVLKIEKIDSEIPNINNEGIEYQVELTKKEVILLLLKIKELRNTEKASTNIVAQKDFQDIQINFNTSTIEEVINEVIKLDNRSLMHNLSLDIDIEFKLYYDEKYITFIKVPLDISFNREMLRNSTDVKKISQNLDSVLRKELRTYCIDILTNYYNDEYTNMCLQSYKKVTFILDCIKDSGVLPRSFCGKYIYKYEYQDPEILFLKKLVFR